MISPRFLKGSNEDTNQMSLGSRRTDGYAVLGANNANAELPHFTVTCPYHTHKKTLRALHLTPLISIHRT